MQKSNESRSYVKYDSQWYSKPLDNVPNISLCDMLKRSARKYGNQIALTDSQGCNLTFSELDKYSDRFASFLYHLGIKKGDRVATQMPNSLEHAIVYFGILKAGGISVPFNVMYKKGEIEYILNDSGAHVLVIWSQLINNYLEIKENVAINAVVSCEITDLSSGIDISELDFHAIKSADNVFTLKDVLRIMISPDIGTIVIDPKDDLQLILYTAGTTGFPKGVMLTHYNFIYNIENRASLDDAYTVGSTALTLFPMFHVSGYMLYLLLTIYVGGRTILSPRFEAAHFLKLIEQYKVNFLTAPPAVWIGMMNHPDIEKRNLSSLMVAMGAGAPVPSHIQEKWEKLTGMDLLSGYGMTETSATAISNSRTKKNLDPGCIGVPLGGEMAIINDEGQIVPRGEVGEIIFRGPQVMKGYWNNEKATREAITDEGWLHTGDMGYVNDQGYTYFVDRKKDLIIASGYNIAPAEIENILLKHPAINEAAVIGVPHEYRGETVKAFVVLNREYIGEILEEDVIAWAKDNMAAYKYPRLVEFVDELPKSQAQKVLRKVLRDQEYAKRGLNT